MAVSVAGTGMKMQSGQRTGRKGISGSTLKMIAIVTMLIDHIGAAVLGRLLMTSGMMEAMATEETIETWLSSHAALYMVYLVLRMIGRVAFPIFCFLMVEGFEHTGNRFRYAVRLGLFALVSEIPFDLAFKGTLLEFGYQNIFFTLFLGFLAMTVYYYIEETQWNRILQVILGVAEVVLFMGAAELLGTDYGARGVLCIMILFAFRKNRRMQILAGCLAFFWWELPALAAFVIIAFYNGERGWELKYFFYLFYPVHLLLLYLVCWFMGIGGISAV